MNSENYYPDDFDKEFENTCGYCGEPCEGDFCSKECLNAFLND